MSKPTNQISTLGEKEDYIIYATQCKCGCDVQQTIWIEVDKYGNFGAAFYTPFVVGGSIFSRAWKALKILLGISIRVEEEILFTEEGIKDYISALQYAVAKFEDEKKKSKYRKPMPPPNKLIREDSSIPSNSKEIEEWKKQNDFRKKEKK